MKNLVIICIVALFGYTASAQPHHRRSRGEGHDIRQKMAQLTPEQHATLKTKEMTLQLDLSESQQTAVQKINLDLAKKRKGMREARKEGEKPSANDLFEARNGQLDEAIRIKKELKSILSEEQFVKFEKGSKRRRTVRHRKHQRKARK